MRNIIKLILKYHFTIIFVLLELISLSLIVMHNKYQRSLFFKYTYSATSSISEQITGIKEYFNLRELTDQLVDENLLLKRKVAEMETNARYYGADSTIIIGDYSYYSAKVVNATFNKTKNHITINKGEADSIKPEMAVCMENKVVGIVQNVSPHNANVLPLINTNLRISAKIKKNNYFGSLQWDGEDYRYSYLKDIPFHVEVEQGDTVVTSGFSSIFPEGEIIGYIESVDKATANFLLIKVKLATDFKCISNVYIIENRNRKERQLIEAQNSDNQSE